MPGGLMTKKHCCLPPGALDELITRIEDLEKFKEAVEGTIQAAITVYAVRRLPDQTRTGPVPAVSESHESEDALRGETTGNG